MSDDLRNSFESMLTSEPRKVGLSEEGAVRRGWVGDAETPPRLYESSGPDVDPAGWLDARRDEVAADLARWGAVLLRGFELPEPQAFEAMVASCAESLMPYVERSTPRSEAGGKLMTSTEYPQDQFIPLHNELSYAHLWPGRIWFYCHTPATEGGRTPIADSRQVYERVPAPVRRRFEERGVTYVRNYGGEVGMSWQEAFQTGERSEVEDFCRRGGLRWEWRGDGRLRTRARRPAVARHPESGETVWFNQANVHHASALDPEVRDELLAQMDESELPFYTVYGDGSPIPDDDVAAVEAAYDAVQVSFPWRRGDVLLLDNMLTAHGRTPYSGPRRILVAMSDPRGDAGGGDAA